MEESLIIGGLGGQGVLVIGKILCHAAVFEKKEITYMENYGDSVRGGSVSCSVVISDQKISSPIVESPTICVALGKAFLDIFEKALHPGGLLVLNRLPANSKPARKDLSVFEIPATELALKLGNILLANMVILGGLIGCSRILRLESTLACVTSVLPHYRKSMSAVNIKAIETGYAYYLSHSKGLR